MRAGDQLAARSLRSLDYSLRESVDIDDRLVSRREHDKQKPGADHAVQVGHV